MLRTAIAGLMFALAPAFASDAALLDVDYRRLAGTEKVNLAGEFGGDVLLVVNTASKCGFTSQYEGLEALHAKYSNRGFAVLGFPSNDFMGQEPGTEKEIKKFCALTYGVKFPMFEKVHVKGDDATELYRALEAKTGDEPGWNFHKYLIDRNGAVIGSFGSKTRPDDDKLVAALEKALTAPVPKPR
ncbi:MAG: glutathione peroxidase [Lysobacterales bacterium]